MWKKTKDENPKPPPLGKSSIEPLKEQAVIGPSISIKGELSGEEDLMIQGRVEGRIDLKKNNITVGKSGRINLDYAIKEANGFFRNSDYSCISIDRSLQSVSHSRISS